jgi:hypothetical protein
MAVALTYRVASCQQPPYVVTVVVPYAAILPITDTADHSLGHTLCDLAGQPYRQISPRLSAFGVKWVVLHENIHVAQTRAHEGGCFGFSMHYGHDEAFRLQMEADAFCGVHDAQFASGVTPDPSLAQIVSNLMSRPDSLHPDKGYAGTWTIDGVKHAMRCWKPATDTTR